MPVPTETKRAKAISLNIVAIEDMMRLIPVSQRELARQAAMSEGGLSALLSGRRHPSADALRRLSEALNVRPAAITIPTPEHV